MKKKKRGLSPEGCVLWDAVLLYLFGSRYRLLPSTQAVSNWSIVGNTSLATSQDPLFFFFHSTKEDMEPL